MLAYLTLKKKAMKRTRRKQLGSTKWEPELNDEVLLKCQPTSDAALGITAKFMRPFGGPWVITKIIPPSCYKISDKEGKIRAVFLNRWVMAWYQGLASIIPGRERPEETYNMLQDFISPVDN